jgi:hypothetical protein
MGTQATLRQKRRRWRRFAIPLVVVVLLYGAVGYWTSGLMIGENPRWRGVNRGPQSFGLAGETVSFSATAAEPPALHGPFC